MGTLHAHPPVKLLVALMCRDIDLLEEMERRIAKSYGEIEDRSQVFLFTFPGRFGREMGPDLKKRIITFKELLPIEKFPAVKKITNDLEWEYQEHLPDRSRRLVNLDPGYLTLSQVVLATTRNYSHHIYLQEGVYGELLLRYHLGALRNLPWTYPDFRTHLAHQFFSEVRNRYHEQLKARFTHRQQI